MNWGKVILAAAVVVVLIVAVGFGINYLGSQQKELEDTGAAIDTPAAQPPVAAVPDTASVADSAAAGTVTAQDGMLSFKVILNRYKDSSSAARRVKTLTSYGNNVEVAMQDSAYVVVMPVTAAPADTAHVLDSLKRTFSPKGVSILQ